MSEDEKTIYALGAMIGQRFAGPMRLSEKELEILQRGVKATARGGQPEFPVAEYAPKFDALARSRAAVGARRTPKAQAAAFRDAAAAEAGRGQARPPGSSTRRSRRAAARAPRPRTSCACTTTARFPTGRCSTAPCSAASRPSSRSTR